MSLANTDSQALKCSEIEGEAKKWKTTVSHSNISRCFKPSESLKFGISLDQWQNYNY